ncbi:MAG: acyl transferase [Sediminibacterium sp.]|nr:acyl transferase [Sediminibacterium sp.]
MSVFRYQYQFNPIYRKWCDMMGSTPVTVQTPTQILPLPVSFFKQETIITGANATHYFESSGTTQTQNSRHWVRDLDIYRQSFNKAFELFYGPVTDWCILALLPAYLERRHSSLVMMADELIRDSAHPQSGFYLYDHERLNDTLHLLEKSGQKTLLLGVTFALLDFAENFPQQLKHTIVMETGGMKGRRKEITRAEVHAILTSKLGVPTVHSEYGMTELLSQAYSKGEGVFECPPWMKVMVRDEEDPLGMSTTGRGVIQVIDLANLYSCSFIATEDLGQVYSDGSFEVWGRLDNSDIRGCSLMVV